jgi:hypothetical protein
MLSNRSRNNGKTCSSFRKGITMLNSGWLIAVANRSFDHTEKIRQQLLEVRLIRFPLGAQYQIPWRKSEGIRKAWDNSRKKQSPDSLCSQLFSADVSFAA